MDRVTLLLRNKRDFGRQPRHRDPSWAPQGDMDLLALPGAGPGQGPTGTWGTNRTSEPIRCLYIGSHVRLSPQLALSKVDQSAEERKHVGVWPPLENSHEYTYILFLTQICDLSSKPLAPFFIPYHFSVPACCGTVEQLPPPQSPC